MVSSPNNIKDLLSIRGGPVCVLIHVVRQFGVGTRRGERISKLGNQDPVSGSAGFLADQRINLIMLRRIIIAHA
jgi:hypothetical protein